METPSTKVTVGALAGAIVAVALWIAQEVADIEPPAAVGAALVVIIGYGLSYFVRETNPAPSAVAEIQSRHTPLAGP